MSGAQVCRREEGRGQSLVPTAGQRKRGPGSGCRVSSARWRDAWPGAPGWGSIRADREGAPGSALSLTVLLEDSHVPTNGVVGKVATLRTLMAAQGSPGGCGDGSEWAAEARGQQRRGGSRGEGAAEAGAGGGGGAAEAEGQRRRGQQRQVPPPPCNLWPPRAGHRGGWGRGRGRHTRPTLPQATGHIPPGRGTAEEVHSILNPPSPADPSAFCRSRGSGKSQPAELGWKKRVFCLVCPGVQAARRAGGGETGSWAS